MNTQEWDDFEQWFEMQPTTVNYTECRAFLSSYLGVTNGKAEVAMADMSAEDKIHVIQTYKAAGSPRRVFLKPLDPITESDVKAVFDGEFTDKDIGAVAKAVHDRTGHDTEQIVEFIKSLENTTISGSTFKWDHAE